MRISKKQKIIVCSLFLIPIIVGTFLIVFTVKFVSTDMEELLSVYSVEKINSMQMLYGFGGTIVIVFGYVFLSALILWTVIDFMDGD